MNRPDQNARPDPGKGFYARFWISQIAALFLNPFVMVFSIRQAIGQLIGWARLLTIGGVSMAAVDVRLPLQGRWRVLNGGLTAKTSHSWGLLAQRYAYDFVRDPGDGTPPLAGWPAFGAPVLAVLAGEVVAVRDGLRDHPRPGTGWIDWRVRDPRGNYVLIRHGQGRFSLYFHLQKGSVLAVPGTHMAQGEVIGAVGNSGHSTEPHLHFQIQDRRNGFTCLGLPPRFCDVTVLSGPQEGDPGLLREGQIIEAGGELPATSDRVRLSAGIAPLWVSLVTLFGLAVYLRALARLGIWLISL